MRRALFILALLLLFPFAVACDNDADDGIAVLGGNDEAGGAAERQFRYLADGQPTRAYADLHSGQQPMFTAAQYEACTRKLAGDLKSFQVTGTTSANRIIPGLEQTAEIVTVKATAEVARAGSSTTQALTFDEIRVDGQWRFVVPDPAAIRDGRC